MKKKVLIAILTSLALVVTFAGAANAHFLGYSAVGNNAISWDADTDYISQWDYAVDTWNALGTINIWEDTRWWTVKDLSIHDFYDNSTQTCGQYNNYLWPVTDTIQLNTYYMNIFLGDARSLNVPTHELGHALGLAHSYSGQIMDGTVSYLYTLQDHDTADYYTLWGY